MQSKEHSTCLVDLWKEAEEHRSGVCRERLLHVLHKLLQVSGVRRISDGCHSSLPLCSCAHREGHVRGLILWKFIVIFWMSGRCLWGHECCARTFFKSQLSVSFVANAYYSFTVNAFTLGLCWVLLLWWHCGRKSLFMMSALICLTCESCYFPIGHGRLFSLSGD